MQHFSQTEAVSIMHADLNLIHSSNSVQKLQKLKLKFFMLPQKALQKRNERMAEKAEEAKKKAE